MKKWIFLTTMLSLMSLTVKAQFDDVYYDPARDSRPATTTTRSQNPQPRIDDANRPPSNDDEYYDNGSSGGGGDYYEYDDDYDDYAYSTRIRRFHQPYRGFDYYSNAYVDYGYYDPYYYNRFFSPGVSIIVGNGYWNRWNSFNRWNSWSWFNRYWDDWRYTSYGFCNPYYYASSFYPSWGYSNYYSPFGYNNFYDPYGYSYNGGWGYNRYNQYNNPYQTGHSNVNNAGNKFYGPRNNGGAIREVTGPNGQVTTGKRGDAGNGNVNPTRNNTPARADVRKEVLSDGATQNGGNITPKRYEAVPSDAGGRTEGATDRPTRTTERPAPNYDRPTRTYDRPAPNYDRPTRTTETTPNNDRPTRTYERPAPNYDRPQRSETPRSEPSRETPRYEAPRREVQRQESPRYEAPRQETPRYEAPRQESRSSSPAPSRSENNGGGGSRRGGN